MKAAGLEGPIRHEIVSLFFISKEAFFPFSLLIFNNTNNVKLI